MRPTGHANVCSVSDTLLYLQLNWVKKLLQARLNALKRWIFLIWIGFGKTLWRKWWTASADLKGQEHQLARDLMTSLWWAAREGNLMDQISTSYWQRHVCLLCRLPCCQRPENTAYCRHHACVWIKAIKLVHLQLGSPGRNLLAQVLHGTQ